VAKPLLCYWKSDFAAMLLLAVVKLLVKALLNIFIKYNFILFNLILSLIHSC